MLQKEGRIRQLRLTSRLLNGVLQKWNAGFSMDFEVMGDSGAKWYKQDESQREYGAFLAALAAFY